MSTKIRVRIAAVVTALAALASGSAAAVSWGAPPASHGQHATVADTWTKHAIARDTWT